MERSLICSAQLKPNVSQAQRAIYPGSFDPITNGHLDILDRTRKLFAEVILVVAQSQTKRCFFSAQERVALLKEVVADRPNVFVELWPGLTMSYAEKNQISAIVRGLRAASDFEFEFMMASMNKEINPNVETLFMMTAKDLFFVSSSMIKELFCYGGDISHYVPPLVLRRMLEKTASQEKLKNLLLELP